MRRKETAPAITVLASMECIKTRGARKRFCPGVGFGDARGVMLLCRATPNPPGTTEVELAGPSGTGNVQLTLQAPSAGAQLFAPDHLRGRC